jgi:hypothetical protein
LSISRSNDVPRRDRDYVFTQRNFVSYCWSVAGRWIPTSIA